jgi:hypothetical protein
MKPQTDPVRDAPSGARAPTVVLEGYIGEMNDEKIIIFPHLDRRYSIELRRHDVLDFEAGLASGACRFLVSSRAPVQERVTFLTTNRCARTAADVSGRCTAPESGGASHS